MRITRATSGSTTVFDYVVLTIVVAVAAITRLPFQNLAEFKDDESHVASLAVSFLEGRMIPLIGIGSSVGVNNPPAFVYLMAIPLALSHDPAIASGFIGLLGVGAVLLCYRFCDEHFDRRTAQVAALLFAAAPWVIVYARKMQAQDVVPFFVMLWVGSLFQLARGRPAYHLVAVALWLNVLLQLHFSAIALIPLTALALAFIWLRLRHFDGATARWGAAAVLLTVALWAPYAIYQATHDLVDLHALKKVLSLPSQTELTSFGLVLEMTAEDAYNGLTGVGYDLYHAQTLSFDWLYLVERLLFVVAVVALVASLAWSRGKGSTVWRDGFLLLWLVVPPLVFLRHSTPLFPHYFLIVYPAQFIAIGRLVSNTESWLIEHRPALRVPASTAVGVLVASLVVTQVYGLLTVMDFIARAPTFGAHGVPLIERQQAIERAVVANAGQSKPVYLTSSGHDYPSAFDYLAHGRLPLKTVDDRDTFVVPADDGRPTVYLTTNPDVPAVGLLHEHFADRLIGTVPFPGSTTGFSLYRLGATANAQLLQDDDLRQRPATLPNGMRFVGYELPPSITAGSSIRLALYWQVAALPPTGEDYAIFTHLVDEHGHFWGQLDDLGYPPYLWQVGDSVVSWFDIDVDPKAPAGPVSIDLGVYRRSDVGRLPISTPDGRTADHLLLGPFKPAPATPTRPPPPQHAQVAHFGSAIDLLGYDAPTSATPGATIDVALTWQAHQMPDADYTTFVHLIDAAGTVVAQSDGRPGLYPTSLWAPGDVTRDDRALQLPPNLSPGSYTVEIGLYRPDTQARLSADGADHVDLATPVVVGQP